MISTGNIIVIGIVLFISGVGAYYYDKQKNTHHLVNAFLWLSWILAAIFAIHIFKLINVNKVQDALALSPLGMMIAALIASASVMKNIAETKAHDLSKSEKEKERKRIFALNVMRTINHTVKSLNESQNKDSMDILYIDFKANMETVQKLSESIFSESILPFLPEYEQKKIYVFYATFTKFLFFKQLSKPNTDSTEDMNGFIEIVKKYKEQFGTYSKEYIDKYKPNKDQK